MLQPFSDQEFVDVCQQLEVENTEGFEFFTESHDVRIFRQYNSTSGLYKYKIYGYLRGAQPELCAQVYRDLDYRCKWDSYVNELKVLLQEGDDREVIYWHVNFPWPMSHRDYVYQRQLKIMQTESGNQAWIVLAKACNQLNLMPEKSGVIRVTDYLQSCALSSDGQGGTRAYMQYYDDPRGSIPTMLINWAAKSGVPSFLSMMQKAVQEYDAYLKKRDEQQQQKQ